MKRLGVHLPENPDLKPEIYVDNIRCARESVHKFFPEVAYERLVSEIEPPFVSLGATFILGDIFGAKTDPKTGFALTHPWSSVEDPELIRAIVLPDIRRLPVYREKLARYRKLRAQFDDFIPGQKVGFAGGQYGKAIAAPLNTVYGLMGEELFIKMYSNPEVVHAAFRKVMDLYAILWEIKQEIEEQAMTTAYLGDFSNTMLSPETFVEFVLPYNIEFARKFTNVESHNCGQITHLMEHIAKYGPFRWVEIGWGTDLSRAREFFGGTTLLPRLGVEFMQSYTPDQTYSHTGKILSSLTGGGIALHSNCIDFEKTKKETIEALLSAVEDFEKT